MIEIRSRKTGELVGFYHKPLEKHTRCVILRVLRSAMAPYWEEASPTLAIVCDEIVLERQEAVYHGSPVITYLEVADDHIFDKAPGIQHVSRLADLFNKERKC